VDTIYVSTMPASTIRTLSVTEGHAMRNVSFRLFVDSVVLILEFPLIKAAGSLPGIPAAVSLILFTGAYSL
jgi:hypothetical protein